LVWIDDAPTSRSHFVVLPFHRVLIFLVFSHHHSPRYLHSFPTRRSSDLSARSTRAVAVTSSWARTRPWARPTAACSAPAWRTWTDRKSTRLNSSHVSISYAVFCLKKKKI